MLSLGYQVGEQSLLHESFTLYKGNAEIIVEMHSDFLTEDFPLRLDVDGVWKRRTSVSLGAAAVDSLSAEDYLLVLCVHGSKHCWQRLQWLCDVAQLIRRTPSLDWQQVIKRARAGGGWRALLLKKLEPGIHRPGE